MKTKTENNMKIQPKDYGIEKSQAVKIETAFMPLIAERDEIAKVYVDLIKQEPAHESCQNAKILRLKLMKVRTGISGVHKKHKAFFLAAGRFVDAWKNKETEPILEMEDRLKLMESHFELIQQRKLDDINDARKLELSKYVDIKAISYRLSDMEDDVWNAYLIAKKSEYIARVDAEKKAESDRIAKEKADAEERKRIEIENKQLKAEAEKRQKLEVIERKKRDKIEAERKAKEDAERKLHEDELKNEREKAEKLKAEIKAKEDAERKRLEAIEAANQAELSKGDTDKVKDLVGDLKSLKSKYTFKSAKSKKMFVGVGLLIDKIINYIS